MSEQIDHQYVQKATVKKITSEQAELELPDGQVIKWPVKLLPSDLKNGDTVRILVHDKQTEEEERQRLAKSLLNEVMNTN